MYEAKLHFVSVFSKKKQLTDCVFLLHYLKVQTVFHIFLSLINTLAQAAQNLLQITG